MVKKPLYSISGRKKVSYLVRKIENGFFNIIIIFGATRTGKSTLARIIGKDMAEQLGVPFTVKEHIHFKAGELVDEGIKGKRRHVYLMDEGAFDLKGNEHYSEAQRKLRKLFNTAAKYNQTYIIIMQDVSELQKAFIKDDHTRGIQVYTKYDPETKMEVRGYAKGYTVQNFLTLYMELKKDKLDARQRVRQSFNISFRDDTYKDPITDEMKSNLGLDMVAYEAKKDAAIASLAEEEEKTKDPKKEHDLDVVLKYVQMLRPRDPFANKIVTRNNLVELATNFANGNSDD